MRLLLASYLHPQLERFFTGTVAYVSDAARTCLEAPFAVYEREQIAKYGFKVADLALADTPFAEIEHTLSSVDGVYVASGETFDLLDVLRSTGAGDLIADRVRKGLPYAGSSAGAMVAGPSIEPHSIMDSPAIAPGLSDYAGLNLVNRVIVPHAQGTLPPYPISIIARTVETYGEQWPLTLLRDGEALLVEDDVVRIV